MKITDLKTYVVAADDPHMGRIPWVFVRLDTDEGISG